jgi:hypothetical protein
MADVRFDGHGEYRLMMMLRRVADAATSPAAGVRADAQG